MNCKVLCTKEIPVFPEYRPVVGAIYDAVFSPGTQVVITKSRGTPRYYSKAEFVVVTIKDKQIVLRKGEFKLVKEIKDE